MSTNFISFSTNRSYQKYATALVKSLQANFNGEIVCRCVNCDDSFVAFLKNTGVIVIIDNVKLDLSKKLKNPFETPVIKNNSFNKNCLCNDEVTYTCHSRFYNAKFIFENYNADALMLIDCDFIIRNNFDEVFKLTEDILIMDSINYVHEDCIVIKNTTESKQFINNVIKELEKNLFFWDQDTIALKTTAKKSTYLKIGELDLKYKDYTLSDNSPIWSGDGLSKYHQKFLNMFNKILELK